MREEKTDIASHMHETATIASKTRAAIIICLFGLVDPTAIAPMRRPGFLNGYVSHEGRIFSGHKPGVHLIIIPGEPGEGLLERAYFVGALHASFPIPNLYAKIF